MDIELLYGHGTLRAALPPGARATIIEKPAMPLLPDPASAVAKALDEPSEGGNLSTLARGAQSACILICDITRPVPNALFLRPIIERLMGAGIERERICVLVATGLHRPNEGPELDEVLGDPWVAKHVTVANHFARNDADHVHLGQTSKGTVVRLDRRFVDADVRIATGLVEPHFMAGYSGGRKVIAPGIAHAETITTFHNHRFMSHPLAQNCQLDGNPLHQEQLEIVERLGGALALNTVIDDKRQLSFVNFGEIVSSHLEAVAFVRRFAEVPIPRRFNTVITSAAGYPLDKTYYQTVKGMVGPLDILNENGDLIIASQCSEGLGSDEYQDAQRRLVKDGVEHFVNAIAQKTHAAIDEWQTQMQLKPLARGQVTLVCDQLSESDQALTGVQISTDLQATIAASIERHGDRHVAVIPEGPYVIPRFEARHVT
ncbi:MAG: nickel-dependent lactate racemase [Gammaproteobacteria bacterium]|jgi:nickel-dependent lactate racemase